MLQFFRVQFIHCSCSCFFHFCLNASLPCSRQLRLLILKLRLTILTWTWRQQCLQRAARVNSEPAIGVAVCMQTAQASVYLLRDASEGQTISKRFISDCHN